MKKCEYCNKQLNSDRTEKIKIYEDRSVRRKCNNCDLWRNPIDGEWNLTLRQMYALYDSFQAKTPMSPEQKEIRRQAMKTKRLVVVDGKRKWIDKGENE